MVRPADLESGEWETADPACSKFPETVISPYTYNIWGNTRKGKMAQCTYLHVGKKVTDSQLKYRPKVEYCGHTALISGKNLLNSIS